MRIAFIGPISPDALGFVRETGAFLPKGHPFGMNADLVNELIARGHEVEVFTTSSALKTPLRIDAKIPHAFTMVPSRGRMSAVKLFSGEISGLSKALSDSGPFDIVHAHWVYEYAAAALSSGNPVLVTVHDWPYLILKYKPSILRVGKYILSRRVQRKIRFATAPSPYMAEIARKHLGIDNVALIANALPGSLLLEEPKSFATEPTLVAINNGFDPRKNVGNLLRAFALLRKDIPSARLRLIGDEYEAGGKAEQFACAQNLADGVHFLGRCPRDVLLSELRMASLFVHPSLEESFGLVLIEAMAQKTPVLGGAASGAVPWVLDGGRAGYLADVTDASRLADEIRTALFDPHLAVRGEAGWVRVQKEFTMDLMVNRFVNQYKEVIDSW